VRSSNHFSSSTRSFVRPLISSAHFFIDCFRACEPSADSSRPCPCKRRASPTRTLRSRRMAWSTTCPKGYAAISFRGSCRGCTWPGPLPSNQAPLRRPMSRCGRGCCTERTICGTTRSPSTPRDSLPAASVTSKTHTRTHARTHTPTHARTQHTRTHTTHTRHIRYESQHCSSAQIHTFR
jgi:hypothetical protein